MLKLGVSAHLRQTWLPLAVWPQGETLHLHLVQCLLLATCESTCRCEENSLHSISSVSFR